MGYVYLTSRPRSEHSAVFEVRVMDDSVVNLRNSFFDGV